jgi:FAD-dependent urate hydroxylase
MSNHGDGSLAESTPPRPEAAGAKRDRQLLVVGHGLTAAACAGFLARAGLDPVLAPPDEGFVQEHAPLVPLWKPGLVLLERLGLRQRLERLGTTLDRVARLSAGRSWADAAAEGPSLVVLRRDRLASVLTRQLHPRLRTTDRSVTALEPTSTGVTASFEGGIAEPFDAAITARPPREAADRTGATPTLHTWTLDWPSPHSRPPETTEAWDQQMAAVITPTGDGAHARVLATPAAAPDAALDVDRLATAFSPLFDSLANPFMHCQVDALRYRRDTHVSPRSLWDDAVVAIGPAARSALPGSLLGPSLGLADGWVLADCLVDGPLSIDRALASYETRRRTRERSLQQHISGDVASNSNSTDCSPLLARLRRSRAIAFGHAIDGAVPDWASGVPGCL